MPPQFSSLNVQSSHHAKVSRGHVIWKNITEGIWIPDLVQPE